MADWAAMVERRDAEIADLKRKLADCDRARESAGNLYLMFRDLREQEADRADRFESAWKSARRRAKTAMGAWRYMRWHEDAQGEEMRKQDEFARWLLDQMSERRKERDRYRLAWLSARRRAADETNFGMEALERKEREVSRWRSGHETAEAQLVWERRDSARLRSFAADVASVRDWTMCAATARDLLESHLRPVYDSLYELEAAEREKRPFVDRVHRRAARGDFDDVFEADEAP